MGNLIEFEGYQVRILNEDGSTWDGQGEPWFIPVDIATAIGYSDPRVAAVKVLSRNPERFRGLQGSTNLVTPGGIQEVTILNENGLYMFLMVARTEKAISFQRKVTEILTQIRQGKYVSTDSMTIQAVKQMLGVVESHNNRIGTMETRVDTLEITVQKEVLITNRQAATVQRAVAARIRDLLPEDYQTRSKQYFSWLYREIYARFAVPSYRDIPRVEFNAVMALIREWAPVQVARQAG